MTEEVKIPDWRDELRTKYNKDGSKIILDREVGVGDGWRKIIETLFAAVEKLAPSPIHIMQIKEKFGGLRIYWHPHVEDAIIQLFDQAEKDSYITCENCGAVGAEVHIKGWIKTLCLVCTDKMRKNHE